jgi:hypothetical protein
MTLTIPIAISALGYVVGIFGFWKMCGHNVGHAAFVLLHGLEKTVEHYTPDKLGALDLSDLKDGENTTFQVIDQYLASESGQSLLHDHINKFFSSLPPVEDVLNAGVDELSKEIKNVGTN